MTHFDPGEPRVITIFALAPENIAMSKQAEFAVLLKLNPMFAVRRGQIRIETGTSDGGRLTLNFLGPGDLFGEVAVLDGQSRTADAAAGEPTELFVLRR